MLLCVLVCLTLLLSEQDGNTLMRRTSTKSLLENKDKFGLCRKLKQEPVKKLLIKLFFLLMILPFLKSLRKILKLSNSILVIKKLGVLMCGMRSSKEKG